MQRVSTDMIIEFMSQFTKKCGYINVLLLSLMFTEAAIAKDIRIALRAHNGAQKGLEQWQPTADYLSKKIPGYNFIMVPFVNISSMNQAVSREAFDFYLTNPSSAVEYNIHYNYQPIATLINKRQGKGYSKFGSVIFTQADRKDIYTLADLKGKTFIAVDEQGFGGWRVAWQTLLKNDINPYVDFKKMSFAGGQQPTVVYAVRDKKVDAGTVRTDMLERLAASGYINLDDYKILNSKKDDSFPFLHSTPLYPEWLFSASENIDPELRAQVASALLSITANEPAPIKGKYIGWTDPMDYSSVDALLKNLHIGPYDLTTMDSFERLVSQYGMALAITMIIFITLSLGIFHMARLNRRIMNAQESLKNEVVTRETLERQLMHIQKMESLGQLTGGIAHDFNNMLASIIGFTELSIDSDAARNDPKLSRYLDQVMTASEKARALIIQMLAFSRSEDDIKKTETLLVSDIIDSTSKLLRPLLPSSINLTINKNSSSFYVKADQVMIDQVLMNLCLNAKDALIRNHGEITISTDVVDFKKIQCDSCHQNISGRYVVILIKDNGCGINITSRHLVFEPFFSTKDISKGAGMGLSMVHGIMHKLKGHILLESKIGKGTTIKLLLPQASSTDDIIDSYKPTQNLSRTKTNTNKHILVIDDEVSITSYLNEILRRHGYRASVFNNSQEALAFFKTHHHDISLVLSDQTMPIITGTEVAKQVLEISSDMPIILCTGFSEHVDKESALKMNISAYMEKPIQSEELLNTIDSLVNPA